MAEIWDLEEHLVTHPEDDTVRWSMAKRYYAAAEYQKALEHLEALRSLRPLRINECRYLGATLYRLGRFSDAERVLTEAVARWSDEIQLYEQLSRVQEAGGHFDAAQETWKRILERQPDHPLGERALRRLKRKMDQEQKREITRSRRFFTTSLETRNCPKCGVVNTEIAVRCWQCGTRMQDRMTDTSSESDTEEETPLLLSTDSRALPPETAGSLLMLLAAGLAVACMLLIILVFGKGYTDAPEWVPLSVSDVFQWRARGGRLALYLVLLVGWPGALRAGMALFALRPRFLPMSIAYLFGVVMAELFCVISFLPGQGLVLACLITGIFSLLGLILLLELPPARALGAWVVHAFLVMIIGWAAFFLTESYLVGEWLTPTREMVAIFRASRKGGGYETLAGTTPMEAEIVWISTGSAWLDRRAPETRLTVLCDQPARNTSLRIYDETGAKLFDYIKQNHQVSLFKPLPGKSYRVVLGGDPGKRISLVLESMLGVTLTPKPTGQQADGPVEDG